MGKKVLVIEFERQTAQLVADTLERHGYTVLLASTGVAGLEQFFNEAPDLIFFNLLMPDVQAADFIQRVRSREQGSKIPIYALSQLSGGSELLIKHMGADGAVPKPVNRAEVLRLVEEKIGHGEHEKAPHQKGGGKKHPPKTAAEAKKAPPREEGIPAHGSLKRTPFYHLLADIFRERGVGTLVLEDPMGKIAVAFRDGCPLTVKAPGFARRLAREGLLSDREAYAARRRAETEDISEQEAAAKMNLLTPEKLEDEARGFAYSILRDLCRPLAARFSWKPGEVKPSSPLDPSVVILLAAKLHIPQDKITGAFEAKNRMAKPVFLAADPHRLPDLKNQPAIAAITDAAEKAQKLLDILRASEFPRDDLLSAAYALALLKIISFEAADVWKPAPRRHAAPAEVNTEAIPDLPFDLSPEPDPAPPAPKTRSKPARPARPAPPAKTAEIPAAGQDSDFRIPESQGVASTPPPEPEISPARTPSPEATQELTDDRLLRLGKQLLHDKTYSKAQSCFIELLDRRGDQDPRLLYLFAYSTFRNRFADQTDRVLDSVDALRKALAIEPRYAEARLELAKIFEELGYIDLAKTELRDLLSLIPEHEEAQRELRSLERHERRAEG